MLDALLKGEAKPEEIAQFARKRAKKKIPEIIAALAGHQMSEHHRKMIRYSLSHMKFIEDQIEEIDRYIAAKIQQAGLDRQWQILQTVPGVQQRGSAKILEETGADMTQFPSKGNLSSWARICPGNNRSAGKNRSNRPTGRIRWLRGALTECAWAAAAKENCFLKEKFWRITTKSRGKKNSALLAVAHTILQLVYEVLRTGHHIATAKPRPSPANRRIA
jgi:transposase